MEDKQKETIPENDEVKELSPDEAERVAGGELFNFGCMIGNYAVPKN